MKLHCKIPSEMEKGVWNKLFQNREFSDVTFLVGATEPKEVKAHRCVLKTGSEKFKKLIDSHDPEKPIPVPEIEADVFHQVLM